MERPRCRAPRRAERGVGGNGVLLLVLLDEADGVADGLDVAELVVGDGDAELVLDGGRDLDHRQRVDVEVLGEGLLGSGVGGGDAGPLLQDLAESGLDLLGAGHAGSSLSGWGSGSLATSEEDIAVVRDGRPGSRKNVRAGAGPARRRSARRHSPAPGRGRPTWPRPTPAAR